MIPARHSDDELITLLSWTIAEDSSEFVFIKNRHRKYLSSVKPLDLALAEEELVNRGVGLNIIENKLEWHIKLLDNPAKALYESVPNSHILKKLISEHRRINHLFSEIRKLNSRLDKISYLTAFSPEFEELINIADCVDASSKHTDIEEQVIFPSLEEIGIEAIPELLRAEQFEVRNYTMQFHSLAFNSCVEETAEMKRMLSEITEKLYPLKRRLMLMEENLLYPIALEVLGSRTWDEFKEKYEKAEAVLK